MEDINLWKEKHTPYSSYNRHSKFTLDNYDTEIQESVLDNDSREVATTIAGHIAKKTCCSIKMYDLQRNANLH